MATTIFPNIPRILTAVAEWLACLLMIVQLTPTQHTKAVRLLPLALIVQIGLQLLVSHWPLILWIPGMLINFSWMFLTIHWCEKTTLQAKIYHLCKAFIIAEFWAAFAWQLYCYFLLQFDSTTLQIIFNLGCYVLLFWGFNWLHHRHPKYQDTVATKVTNREVSIAVLTAIMVFAFSNLGFMLSNTVFNFGDSITIFMMRTFIDLCGIFLLLLQDNQRYENFLKDDLSAINNMFNSQYKQYQAYQESSQLVNQRFHDLKHQLAVIALENRPEKRQAYIDQINADIQQYKSVVKTGNATADVILTRKNTYCIQNNITFTCIADGNLLNMLNTMDLCSLLGNSLDNAIESVSKIPDPDRRIIKMVIQKRANFVLFSIQNYTEQALKFDNELPETTKKDKQQHGYGLKSLSYIANKYGGSMSIDLKDNWFNLSILLPTK